MAARREHISEVARMNVRRKLPREEAYLVIGKGPNGTRWVDTDKGDRGIRRRGFV